MEFEGVRYSHVIDPRTGWGVTHRMAATVVAEDGATADALSTALTVMSPREAAEFARGRAGVSVLLHHIKSDGEHETWLVDDFERVMVRCSSGK
jgi:thiamine biosynthesis lipoprotein